jgi:protein kinase-like protein
MGEVYRARDPRLNRDVAVKILHASVAADPERLRRVTTEAQAMAALNHPNVLTIHEVGAHGDHPFITTELLKGATLRASLDAGVLPISKAIDYAPDPRRTGGGAQQGRRASRHQAGESVRHARRPHQDPRLRPRQGGRARRAARERDVGRAHQITLSTRPRLSWSRARAPRSAS